MARRSSDVGCGSAGMSIVLRLMAKLLVELLFVLGVVGLGLKARDYCMKA
ncbi:hypothetical protein NC652_025997 [Populus alba x Populus x berolinensis]|nr:hypothetical protein NC652_025997 [Populus alba x Populus x berolinensis]